jgi:putative tryptophan/tyrosine transport system substrate-binding protein
MTKKIIFLALCSLLLAPCCAADAQQPGKIHRIGYLDGGTASGMATVLLNAFRHELGKLGWVEGKNIAIEYRFAENKGRERFPELAAELVRIKVDLIVVNSVASASAAKSATTSRLLKNSKF